MCIRDRASLDLFESNDVLANANRNAKVIAEELAPLNNHPQVGEIRQKGTMIGIELVADCTTMEPFPAEHRLGHQVTLQARKRGVILRPLSDVIVLIPAIAMPEESVRRLCQVAVESIQAAINDLDSVAT